jgi:hypothetical protein
VLCPLLAGVVWIEQQDVRGKTTRRPVILEEDELRALKTDW